MDSTKDVTPSTQTCSLACSLDWGFSSFFNTLIKSLVSTGLTFIGLAVLIFSIVQMYEYGEGLADLSRYELIYFILVYFLLKRVRAVIKKSTVPFFKAIFSPLILIGQLAVVLALLVGGLALMDLTNKTDMVMNIYLFEETQVELVTYVTVILGLYCGVPAFKTRIPEDTKIAITEELNSTEEQPSPDSENSTEQSAT